jgi:mono/diheme cytochrome c family protein
MHRATGIGVVIGIAAVVVIAGLWLGFGPPVAWPGRVALALQERRGEQVYTANCVTCHGGPIGGTIDDDPPRHNANGHTWHHPDCALRQMVRGGSAVISEGSRSATPMQPFKDRLSPEEIDAVIAYIKTLWLPWQREAQATFTREMCLS